MEGWEKPQQYDNRDDIIGDTYLEVIEQRAKDRINLRDVDLEEMFEDYDVDNEEDLYDALYDEEYEQLKDELVELTDEEAKQYGVTASRRRPKRKAMIRRAKHGGRKDCGWLGGGRTKRADFTKKYPRLKKKHDFNQKIDSDHDWNAYLEATAPYIMDIVDKAKKLVVDEINKVAPKIDNGIGKELGIMYGAQGLLEEVIPVLKEELEELV